MFTTNAVIVTVTASLPYTVDEFSGSVQIAYTYSIAATLDVYPQFVTLTVQGRRRRSDSITVDAAAKVPAEQLSSISSKIADTTSLTASLNANLQSYGLKAASGLSVATQTISISTTDMILSRLSNVSMLQSQLSSALGANAVLVGPILAASDPRYVSIQVRISLSISDFDQSKSIYHCDCWCCRSQCQQCKHHIGESFSYSSNIFKH